MSYRSFSLLGAPGCGKGTQGKIIGSVLGFLHLSSGDMFRGLRGGSFSFIDGKTTLQASYRDYIRPNEESI